MHKTQILFFIAAALALSTGLPGAERRYAPVMAKERVIQTKVFPDGSEEVVGETYGRFLRTSSGDQLMTHCRSKATAEPVDGTYIDRASGKMFDLSYSSKTARLSRRTVMADPVLTADYVAKARRASLGERVVNGVPCLLFKSINGSDGSTIGAGCWSPEYDLHVRQEVEYPRSGYKLRVLREMYDIQLNVEPLPGEVSIPADFTVVQ